MIPPLPSVGILSDHGIDLARFAVSGLVMVLLALISRRLKLGLEGDLMRATARGFIQIVLLASVILFIFERDIWALNILVLGIMILLASRISAARSRGLPGNDLVAFRSILTGSSIILSFTLLLGVFPPDARYLIPLGGMVIGNCMNVTSLALDRLGGEVRHNRMRIEASLALGSSPQVAMGPAVRSSIRASLIPGIDSLNTLGVIWIPGLMAGMLIAGTDPYEAAALQLLIIVMIIGANVMAAILSTNLMVRRLFTPALQLVRLD